MQTILHELKIWPEYFDAIARGDKTFEVRKNDRDFRFNQELLLREWNPDTQSYTGRILHRRISYVLHGGQFGISYGFVIMGIPVI